MSKTLTVPGVSPRLQADSAASSRREHVCDISAFDQIMRRPLCCHHDMDHRRRRLRMRARAWVSIISERAEEFSNPDHVVFSLAVFSL